MILCVWLCRDWFIYTAIDSVHDLRVDDTQCDICIICCSKLISDEEQQDKMVRDQEDVSALSQKEVHLGDVTRSGKFTCCNKCHSWWLLCQCSPKTVQDTCAASW